MNKSMKQLIQTMQDAVKTQAQKSESTAYDTPATVRRIEGDTAWVHINGGVDETPVKLTIAAKAGDEVQVRVSGGRAFLVGNGTAPPTDDAEAIYAKMIAHSAESTATLAKDTAETAQETAEQVQGIAEDAQSTANNAIVSYNDINLFINGGYLVETTAPYSAEDLYVDKTIFYESVGEVYGVYTFTFDGSNWKLNGTTVNLIDYGISLYTTPASGDEITVNLIDVEGAVTDLNDQITALGEEIDATEAKAASDLESAQDELQAAIDANASVITQTQNTVASISTKTQNMSWSDNYGLVLFAPNASFDTGYKLQLAAQAINFRNGSLNNAASVLASIAADPDTDQVFMMISDAIIENQLRLGHFAFIPRANGNMSLKYLG